MSQRNHVQNPLYANKSGCMYVRDIHQLLNPAYFLKEAV